MYHLINVSLAEPLDTLTARVRSVGDFSGLLHLFQFSFHHTATVAGSLGNVLNRKGLVDTLRWNKP